MNSRIQAILNNLVRQNREQGLQVAAYHRGELIFDVWAGLADPSTNRAVDGQTLFPIFSVSKGISATLVHLLAERGKLDYEARVADYWPEFGANGKQDITLRQVLNHTAGIPHLPAEIGDDDLKDWGKMCAVVTELRPLWEPGTREAYHALTSGWIWGEVMRRVDGREFSQRLNEDIRDPLGLEDLYIGTPNGVEERIAILEEIGPPWQSASPPAEYLSVPDSLQPLFELMNRPAARRACLPAASGIMSARSIAKHYSALLPGGIDGVELLPQSRIAAATQLPSLGYSVDGVDSTMGAATAFGHGGHGGAMGFADPSRQLAFGFARNRLRGPNHPDTARLVADEIRKSL